MIIVRAFVRMKELAALALWLMFLGCSFLLPVAMAAAGPVPSTLDGPFRPVTVPFDRRLRSGSDDLPNDDPRLAKKVGGDFPEQIGISQSFNPDAMHVSWITGDYQLGSCLTPSDPSSVASVVIYGSSRRKLTHMAKGSASIYSQIYPFEGLQNYTSGIIHHVLLTGLQPNTTYFYKCGDPSIKAMSKLHSFTTLPVPGPSTYPARIAIVGDLGLTYNTTSTLQHLIDNDPNLALFVGDLSYANLYLTNGTGSGCYHCTFANTPIHETYQPRWDYWGRYLEPLRSKVPTMMIEGNHEYEEQINNDTFVAYNARFAVPALESGSNTKMYYSFTAGGAHFVMLGGYVDFTKTSAQYEWLLKDLNKVDRSITPWLIATFHAPWYTSYKSHYREAECMRIEMEELLYNFGVDIVFAGHVHAYERMNRVYNYTYDPCAPVHITIGDGGNREALALVHADDPSGCPKPASTPDDTTMPYKYCGFNFTWGPASGKFCWDRQPEWSAFRDSSFGHGILEIKNSTHALWTWHRNQDIYQAQKAGDEIYIVRQPDACPNLQNPPRSM